MFSSGGSDWIFFNIFNFTFSALSGVIVWAYSHINFTKMVKWFFIKTENNENGKKSKQNVNGGSFLLVGKWILYYTSLVVLSCKFFQFLKLNFSFNLEGKWIWFTKTDVYWFFFFFLVIFLVLCLCCSSHLQKVQFSECSLLFFTKNKKSISGCLD